MPLKDAKTIDRFKQGASARIKVKKMKTENARNIASKYYYNFRIFDDVVLVKP